MEKDADLRKKIIQIQTDPSLDPQEKSRRVQMLMSGKWFENNVTATSNVEEDLVATFNDEPNQVYGCKHYKRGCKLKAKCCGRIFACRFCHDENSQHQMDRFDTQEVMCQKCKTIQPVTNVCTNSTCGISFARYFCDICKFYDDDPAKSIYHCPQCKICRIGKGLGIDYCHCDKCNACLSIKNFEEHACIENKLGSNCPICSQNMFHSTHPCAIMRCGHGIHIDCLAKYQRTNYKCPLCSKSLLDDMSSIWSEIEEDIAAQPMPLEFTNYYAKTLCNDCNAKTVGQYHFIGIKCGECGGYNTSILQTFKKTEESSVIVDEN
jgi:hypothetical protein